LIDDVSRRASPARELKGDIAIKEERLGFLSQRGEILLRERSSPMGETCRKSDRDFREGQRGPCPAYDVLPVKIGPANYRLERWQADGSEANRHLEEAVRNVAAAAGIP
jgi:hypothetical protein